MIDFIDKCGVRGTSNCYEEEQIRANPDPGPTQLVLGCGF